MPRGSASADGLQRRLDRPAERVGDAEGGFALLLQDPLYDCDGLPVADAFCYELELLVAADLEMLERAGEGGELPGRVGVAAEERYPVERPQAERGVLQRRRIAA